MLFIIHTIICHSVILSNSLNWEERLLWTIIGIRLNAHSKPWIGSNTVGFVIQDSQQVSKYRVEEYVDSTTSGYQSLPESASAPSQAPVILHEYCVPPGDVDYFLTMFRFTKRVKNQCGFKP